MIVGLSESQKATYLQYWLFEPKMTRSVARSLCNRASFPVTISLIVQHLSTADSCKLFLVYVELCTHPVFLCIF